MQHIETNHHKSQSESQTGIKINENNFFFAHLSKTEKLSADTKKSPCWYCESFTAVCSCTVYNTLPVFFTQHLNELEYHNIFKLSIWAFHEKRTMLMGFLLRNRTVLQPMI